MEDRLGVAPGPIAMPARLKKGPEGRMVIDFAVEGDPNALVFVCHRLVAPRDIHDGQPAMPKPDRSFNPEALIIGTAVDQRVPHGLEAAFLDGFLRIEFEDSDNSAHRRVSAR